ncbi:hypothetical protein GTGU_00002 [Trabulsiella guamensis ATCC 49490]|uniref:HTH luxR-type domain-containing protein n=1 Tax=Trabulsiella guamensis ATCC 49490 TaxID=1005994 RepID=A0A085ASU2_9ENTR|nr:LuxR C-terminal-related transcriptional regulator [Trabulsiella guamensis]KFC13287.1 hypothetical protein GTGU_00002 [Trabulsiella guamensis ATCC 49490]
MTFFFVISCLLTDNPGDRGLFFVQADKTGDIFKQHVLYNLNTGWLKWRLLSLYYNKNISVNRSDCEGVIMNRFTVILTQCNFSSVGLMNLLFPLCGNENIVSFRNTGELYEWRKRISGEVSLTLYIIMPAILMDARGFDKLISSAPALNDVGASEVVIINEHELLPELFVSVCSDYGWQVIDICGISCDEIRRRIADRSVEKSTKRNDVIITRREQQVLGYLLKGLTVREINNDIGISMKTTYSFCNTLKNKLGLFSTYKIYEFRHIIDKALMSGIIRMKY